MRLRPWIPGAVNESISAMTHKMVGKIFGIASLGVTLISVPLNVISGIGVFVALLGLILAGISVLLRATKYALIAFLIATISIFIISPFSLTQSLPLSMVAMTLIPYLFFIATLIFRFISRKPT